MADAEDTAQLVLTKLVSGLRNFEYDAGKGGFRAYLFRCSRSGLSDFFQRQAGRGEAVVPDESLCSEGTEAFAAFEREWVDHHYRLAVERYRQGADEKAMAIFDATIAGRSVREIADEHGMNENAVHKAQQRLRDRLRALIAEQLADEEDRHERRG